MSHSSTLSGTSTSSSSQPGYPRRGEQAFKRAWLRRPVPCVFAPADYQAKTIAEIRYLPLGGCS